MKNADIPAMPVPLNPGSTFQGHGPADGLTKREHFAALAMQGILAHDSVKDADSHPIVAEQAINFADALLGALEEN